MVSPKLVDDIQHPLDISKEQENNHLSYNEESMLIYDSHVPSFEFYIHLQQYCQSFCDQMYKDSHPYVSLDFSFPKSFIQEQIGLSQFCKAASVKTLDTQTSYIIEL